MLSKINLRHLPDRPYTFGIDTIPPGILSLPELANRLGRLIQPFTICQQRHEFNSAEKLDRVGVWPAQGLQLARSDQNGDVLWRAVQQLGHADSQQQAFTSHVHPAHSVIEELVEGLAENIWDSKVGCFNTLLMPNG